jgi:hypothetical protein
MRLMNQLSILAYGIVAATSMSSSETDRLYPPRLPSDKTVSQPTQEQKLWALATCAWASRTAGRWSSPYLSSQEVLMVGGTLKFGVKVKS